MPGRERLRDPRIFSGPPRRRLAMIVGMLISAAIAAFGLLVALGRIGHPIDAQLVSNYGWSILIIGAALFVLFAVGRFNRTRKARSPGRSA
jgi:divalent metal cation (Fe/Co/Zn/Cd) transporter